MKILQALFILCSLILPINVLSAEASGFANTSEEIVKQLSASKNFATTRSFMPANIETRGIVIRLKKKNGTVDKPVVVPVNDEAGVARLKIKFDTDSARLRPEAYRMLDEAGKALIDSKLAGKQICIKGHTDSDGSSAYNLGLSYKRAEAVRGYILAHQKLNPSDLFVIGYGEQLPLMQNSSPINKQLNRRVELSISCPEIE